MHCFPIHVPLVMNYLDLEKFLRFPFLLVFYAPFVMHARQLPASRIKTKQASIFKRHSHKVNFV